MKIKTKTSLIICSISLALSVALASANLVYDLFHQQIYLNFLNKIMSDFSEWNNRHSVNNIGPFAELYIELEASRLGQLTGKIFRNCGKDYQKLINDQELRQLINDSTYINKIRTSYAAIIKNGKDILVASDKNDEGQNINVFLKDCSPQLQKYFAENKLNKPYKCYFTYFDNTDQSTSYEYASIYPIPGTDLMIIYILSLEDYLQPINKDLLEERNIEKKRVEGMIHDSFKTERRYTILFIFLGMFAIFLFSTPVILKFSNSITEPIKKLRDEVQKLGKGYFNISLEETGFDEIKDLINTFNSLGRELSLYTENLKTETALRQKIETEINIAHKIQEATLPKNPPDNLSKDIQLAAKLLPAEKMAGDFYDYFFSKDKLVLCIADVSGKGLSAAFFMAITKTLIRNLCFQKDDPAKILYEANKTLSSSNSAHMFATVFLSFYDHANGKLTFSNAGHESVFLVRNRNITELGSQGCLPVGLFNDSNYISEEIDISKGDMLVFYTDGITEARSRNKSFFGPDNLKKIISDNIELTPQEQCNIIVSEVSRFEGNYLYDDMTIMIFKKN